MLTMHEWRKERVERGRRLSLCQSYTVYEGIRNKVHELMRSDSSWSFSVELRIQPLFSPWQTAMEAMGLIAIIVNCYLIGQCGQLQRLFPWLSPEMAIISIVILEVRQLLCSESAC